MIQHDSHADSPCLGHLLSPFGGLTPHDLRDRIGGAVAH